MSFRLSDKIALIDVNSMIENPANWQLHGQFDPLGKDKWLCENVKSHGVLLPVLLLPNGQLTDGHRRRRAAMQAGLSAIPAIVAAVEDADQAYASAQLGRNMSLYAKCLLFREAITSLMKAGSGNRAKNLRQNKISAEPEHDINNDWITLELILGVSKQSLSRGMRLLEVIDKLNEVGDYEQAGRVVQIFRDRGLKPARRFLGFGTSEKESEATDDESDCQEWTTGDERNRRSRGPQAKDTKGAKPAAKSTAKTPPAATAPSAELKWQRDANKALAHLESLLKDNHAYSANVQKAMDVIEKAIGWNSEKAA